MPRFKKVAAPALAALLLVSLPALPVLAETAAQPAAKEQAKEQPKSSSNEVVQKVNGTPILKKDLDRAVKILLEENHVPQPVQPEVLKKAQEAALDQLTSMELLYQQAAKVEVKDLDKQVADKVESSKAKIGSKEDFEKALKAADMTPQDLQDFTRKDIVIGNFIETRFNDKGTVTDAEAKKFYDDNLEKFFKKPETVRASHILIGVDEKASAEDKKKAKQKADAVLKRVKGGEDFAAIAKAESSCPSAAQGGDLGDFTRGQMVSAFETTAFTLKPGQISEVVETQFGYHIIKVTEKHEASTDKYEDVKPKITEYLKKQKAQKALSDYVDDLKKNAKIEKM
ncbi:peptidylprolyl isomerase [Geomonas sp.]|uniref:peptidylprolyl isomerase n=1 Tax=Geomonas sp. TaxID=2651584 RepID=UPI002B494BAF|nr:peptidylprolyl isomerase [Geomonas sp.]HJV35145.1 peptidylprolyl isomerase [Geomonas sp.]